MNDKRIRQFGSGTGIAAALLLSLNISTSGWAFPLYLLSNAAWLYIARKTGDNEMFVMFMVFSVISANGVYQWLF